MSVLHQYLIVLINKLASLHVLIMQLRLVHIRMIVLLSFEGIPIDSAKPFIQILLKDVCSGN